MQGTSPACALLLRDARSQQGPNVCNPSSQEQASHCSRSITSPGQRRPTIRLSVTPGTAPGHAKAHARRSQNQIAPFRLSHPRSLQPPACPASPSLRPLQQQQSPAQQQGQQSQPRAAVCPAGSRGMAPPACSSCAKARAASRSGSEENKKQLSSPQLGPGDADTVTVLQRRSLSVAPLLPCVPGELPMEKRSKKKKQGATFRWLLECNT